MSKRLLTITVIAVLLAFTAACTNKKSANPLAGLGSKQPDKVLFDKAMDAMRHNRFDVARLTLQTLINTYPDSEFVARAKLAVGDSWYAEGGSAALAQAEQEYDDFITFFPNMPEAAEAQLKKANIHYQQMEKADRDYTHALRAEDEYRKVILQFPDSKLVPEAKQRLLEVQEVLAEREFEIGRFYAMRESYPASEARLQTMIDKYPLYSRADEALWLLGQDYEGQIARIRNAPKCDARGKPPGCMAEKVKEEVLARISPALIKQASDAYDKILTRYPLMDRSDDAKKRLEALHQPVPRPTKAALKQNEAEIASRTEATMSHRIMEMVKKGPDVSQAAKTGEPTIVDPAPVSAPEVARHTQELLEAPRKGTVGVEVLNAQPGGGAPTVADSGTPGATPFGQPNSGTATAQPPAPDPNELKPTPDANELKPNDAADLNALPPPPQVNEIQPSGPGPATASGDSSSLASDKEISSSKKKKKKGLKKLNPF
jgi:outer membrane protein assembly factor BamD